MPIRLDRCKPNRCQAAREIDRLANWLLANTEGPQADEGAVDVAIRLIRESQRSAVDRLADLARTEDA